MIFFKYKIHINMNEIIRIIKNDFYEKGFSSIDEITYIREENTDYNPMIFLLYITKNTIEIYNELYETLGIISFENWINDWKEFKYIYCNIIDEYYHNYAIDNLCKYISLL